MVVLFNYLPEFERRAKSLAKKYRSFKSDYDVFLNDLEANPFQGVSLGGNVFKTRMQIKAKGKGKSGGARVLTYNVNRREDLIEITLMSIFDKNEMENVSDAYIKSLVKALDR